MLKLKSINFNHQLFQDHVLEPSYSGQLEWLIGRDPRCHLVLSTLDVSRTHGRIFYRDGAYQFENSSQHGSTLNGEILLETTARSLNKGDLLLLGETYLHIEELSLPSFDDLILPSLDDPAPPRPLVLPSLEQGWWTSGDLQVRCCQIIDETADVKTFCFVADPPLLFNYKPGQFVNLEVEINGKTLIRPYSISSSPTRPYHLAITIKRVTSPSNRPDLPPGLVSNWLHDHLIVGDRVTLRGGPLGTFTCLPNLPAKMLLVSAGSGITPMMSMARWVQDSLCDAEIVFLHSARTPNDIIFRNELETMAVQMPNFRLAITMTRPAGNWMGLTGRISGTMLQMVAPDLLDRTVYVCGPTELRQQVKTMLEKVRFPMQNYHEESFGGRSSATAFPTSETTSAKTSAKSRPKTLTAMRMESRNQLIADRDRHHSPSAVDLLPERNGKGQIVAEVTARSTSQFKPDIQFVKSAVKIQADPDLTILELAEQEGVSIPNACRAGACGACKVRTQQGEVRYHTTPTALTAADQQAGYVLACVAQPVDRLVVEA